MGRDLDRAIAGNCGEGDGCALVPGSRRRALELEGKAPWQLEPSAREFEPGADEAPPIDPMSRRNFFHLMGASMGMAGLGLAAVEGFALGGGFEVCLACDLIVASKTARMGLTEVKFNLGALGGGLLRLPQRLPYHLAMEMILTAELKGGPDDAEELYCAAVEWEWGDGTKSQSNVDCEPYEKGKSEIKRRYVIDHTFQTGNNYRVDFRLKQKNKVVASGQTNVTVRPGLHDGIGGDR